jgi:uncharacterized coiled-coil protein SlyX
LSSGQTDPKKDRWKMTHKEIVKYEQELTELSKAVIELRTVEEGNKRHSGLKSLYQKLQTLAANVGAPLSSANILNTKINVGEMVSASVESQIGELINNIHNTLQTKMMRNATPAKGWGIWTSIKRIPLWIYYILGALAALLTVLHLLGWLEPIKTFIAKILWPK